MNKKLLYVVCLAIIAIVGVVVYLGGFVSKEIATEGSNSTVSLATSTAERKTEQETTLVATSSTISTANVNQASTEVKKVATSTKDSVVEVSDPYPMDDLVLRPDEVSYDYRPMGTTREMVTNPGFMTGELRDNFMFKGVTPEAVKRIYGGLYKNYENRYDLFNIAYEYDSLAKMQSDLPHINAGLKEDGIDDRATITVYKNYVIVVIDDDGNASLEFIMLLTEKLRSKLPGYINSNLETSIAPYGKSIEKLSGSYTIKDLILQPNEVPSRYVLQESLLEDENIANPGFVTGDIQNELLSEIGASPTLVKKTYGVQYQNSASNVGLSILVLEYGTVSQALSSLSSISTQIIEQELEGYVTATAFEKYLIYIYADESVELTTLLTKALRTKLPN